MSLFDTSFWQGFLGNFFADLAAALIIAVPVALIVNSLTWAEAKIVLYEEPAEGEGPDTVRWQFLIKNVGRVSFKPCEIYWHILATDALLIRHISNKEHPEQLDPFVMTGETSFSHMRLIRPNQTFYHWAGLNKGPVFASNDDLFLMLVDVKASEEREQPIYFALSTAHGRFPVKKRFWTRLRLLILRIFRIRKASSGTYPVFEDYGLVERVNFIQ